MEYSTNVGVRGVNSKGDRSTRFRVSEYRDCSKELLGEDEGRVELGDQRRDLPGPLRVLVRGARTWAEFRRNLQ